MFFRLFTVFFLISSSTVLATSEREREEETNYFSALPNEMVLEVLKRVDTVSLIEVSKVDRWFYGTLHKSEFIERLFGLPSGSIDSPLTTQFLFDMDRDLFLSRYTAYVRSGLLNLFEQVPLALQLRYWEKLNRKDNSKLLLRGTVEFLIRHCQTTSAQKKFILMAHADQLLKHHSGKHDVLGNICTLLGLEDSNLIRLAEHAESLLYDLDNHTYQTIVNSLKDLDPNKTDQVLQLTRQQYKNDTSSGEKIEILRSTIIDLGAKLPPGKKTNDCNLLSVLKAIFT